MLSIEQHPLSSTIQSRRLLSRKIHAKWDQLGVCVDSLLQRSWFWAGQACLGRYLLWQEVHTGTMADTGGKWTQMAQKKKAFLGRYTCEESRTTSFCNKNANWNDPSKYMLWVIVKCSVDSSVCSFTRERRCHAFFSLYLFMGTWCMPLMQKNNRHIARHVSHANSHFRTRVFHMRQCLFLHPANGMLITRKTTPSNRRTMKWW